MEKLLKRFFPTPTLHPSEQLVKDIATIVDYRGGNQAIEVTPEQCAAIASAFEDANDLLFVVRSWNT